MKQLSQSPEGQQEAKQASQGAAWHSRADTPDQSVSGRWPAPPSADSSEASIPAQPSGAHDRQIVKREGVVQAQSCQTEGRGAAEEFRDVNGKQTHHNAVGDSAAMGAEIDGFRSAINDVLDCALRRFEQHVNSILEREMSRLEMDLKRMFQTFAKGGL